MGYGYKKKNKNLKKLGIDVSKIRSIKSIDDVINTPPAYVSLHVNKTCVIGVDNHQTRFRAGDVVVMPISFYNQKYDKILKPNKKKFKDMFNRYRGEDLDNKKLLIFRQGGFGDIIFAQGIVKYLKDKYPTCEIIFATAAKHIDILKAWPEGLLDNIIEIPFSAKVLKDCDYHLSFEGAIERCPESREVHAFDVFSQIANLDIDYNIDKYKPSLIPSEESEGKFSMILPEKYILCQLRASSPIRMMSENKWISFLTSILETDKYSDLEIVISDTPNKSELYDKIIEKFPKELQSRIHNFSSLSTSILDTITLVNRSIGVVGIDSVMCHIAGALDKPLMGIFSSFDPNLRLSYYNKSVWVEPDESRCPNYKCFYHSHQEKQCPSLVKGKPPICFDDISLDKMLETFDKFISKGKEKNE